MFVFKYSILSAAREKGVNALQQGPDEIQKGTIIIGFVLR